MVVLNDNLKKIPFLGQIKFYFESLWGVWVLLELIRYGAPEEDLELLVIFLMRGLEDPSPLKLMGVQIQEFFFSFRHCSSISSRGIFFCRIFVFISKELSSKLDASLVSKHLFLEYCAGINTIKKHILFSNSILKILSELSFSRRMKTFNDSIETFDYW